MRSLLRQHGLRLGLWCVSALSVVAFIGSGLLLYRVPEPVRNPAWIAVLQPSDSAGSGHQIRVTVSPLLDGPFTDDPRGTYVTYAFSACGAGSLDLLAIWGDDARLVETSVADNVNAVNAADHMTADWSSGEIAATFLYDTQWMHVAVDEPPPCFGLPGDDDWVGAGAAVTGYSSYPWVSTGSQVAFIDPPRLIVSAPLIGGLDESRNIREVEISGIEGKWIRPPRMTVDITGGYLPLEVEVESARPPVRGGSTVSWTATGPIRPSAMLRNIPAVELLQLTFTVSGVIMGILLGTLFQGRRVSSRGGPSRNAAPMATAPPSATPSTSSIAVAAVWVAALCCARYLRRP